jgi:hypothetical protein
MSSNHTAYSRESRHLRVCGRIESLTTPDATANLINIADTVACKPGSTNSWKARFQYRRAAVRFAVKYEAYVKLRDEKSLYRPSAPQQDHSILLRALFREIHLDWRDALPDGFTERQTKEQGYNYEQRAFNQKIQDRRRWNLLAETLGLGALLLTNTSKNNEYIQRQTPMPVFAAWTLLISRVRLDLKEVAARVEGYCDGMENPSFYVAYQKGA